MALNTKENREKQKINRIGEERTNYQGYMMKIIEYNSSHDIIVEFQDEYKYVVNTTYYNFSIGKVKNYAERLNEERYNTQGCLMKIIEYNNALDIIVEFQDKYKHKVHTGYSWFVLGNVKNPYHPSVLNIGIIGSKYPATKNDKMTKEYQTWSSMLKRCFDDKYKRRYPTYKDVTCCEEWLLYENFFEWLHEQENFDKWLNGERWCLDKDILIKGNKIYSPNTCCLVPENINLLFVRKHKKDNLPNGVTKNGNLFKAMCMNLLTKENEYLGSFKTLEQAFAIYKLYKENSIKQIAGIEYKNRNITEKCYIAMMNYKIELDD